jgi:hypothetical protein
LDDTEQQLYSTLFTSILYTPQQSYLAQIADYITKRAGQAPPTLGGTVGTQNQNQQSAYPSGGFSGVGDPTGFATNVSNSYGSSSSSGAAVSKHFPVKSYLVFESGDVSKVRSACMMFFVSDNIVRYSLNVF